MKKIYLHIGFHKTGTTSFQVLMKNNREKLKNQGYLYPIACCPDFSVYGQHILPWCYTTKEGYIPILRGNTALINDKNRKFYINSLKKEINLSSANKVVISSEEFDILSTDEILEFKKDFSEYAIIPIMFIRNFPSLMESLYKTSIVQASYNNSIDNFYLNQGTRFDLVQLINDWREIAHNSEIHVINYENKKIIVDSAIYLLSIISNNEHLNIVALPRKLNRSVPAFIVEILKFMRAKNIAEKSIEEWMKNCETIFSKRNENNIPDNFTLLPVYVREKLSNDYKKALASIKGLSCVFHGFDQKINADIEKKVVVDNLVKAITILTEQFK